MLDASSSEPDLCSQLQTLQTELNCYQAGLCDRASLIVVNKMDAAVQGEETLAPLLQAARLPVFPLSALHHWNVDVLIGVYTSEATSEWTSDITLTVSKLIKLFCCKHNYYFFTKIIIIIMIIIIIIIVAGLELWEQVCETTNHRLIASYYILYT